MNKPTDLKALVHTAQLIGCSLYLGDKIYFVTYTSTGKVNDKYCYDHADIDCVKSIRCHIDKIAGPLRKTWGAEFMELAPIAFQLGYTVVVDDYSARLVQTTGTEEEEELLECAFSSEGLHQMSDYLAQALLGDQLSENITEKSYKEEEDIMESVVITKELAEVITIIYYRMSPEERQGIQDNAGTKVNQYITDALKISANA